MIQMNSRMEVADNTGAKQAMMIRRLGQAKKTASVGDVVVCNIKENGMVTFMSSCHKSSRAKRPAIEVT